MGGRKRRERGGGRSERGWGSWGSPHPLKMLGIAQHIFESIDESFIKKLPTPRDELVFCLHAIDAVTR